MVVPWLCLLASVALLLPEGAPLATGAPKSTCNTLLPKHSNTSPQTSPSPFMIEPAKLTVPQGGLLSLLLYSPQQLKFKGFLVQARSVSSGKPVGTFTKIPANAKTIDCNDELQNTVTHTDALTKSNITLEWQAPGDFEGNVVFNATMVQAYDTYWSGIVSNIQVVDHSGDDGPHSVGISTTMTPVIKTRATTPYPQFTSEITTKSSRRQDPIYNDCYKTKTCFGNTNDCISKGNCAAFVSCLVKGDKYEFELQGSSPFRYVAVGLSSDKSMGGDSVMECVQDGTGSSAVNAYMSWNNGRSNTRIQTNGIELVNSSFVDGVVYCKFTRDVVTHVMNQTFDLANTEYYLLIAAGENLKDNGVGYHDLKESTDQQKFLSDVTGFSTASKLLLRLHGAFMVAAWIGTASLGILLARYFKQTWVGKQLCGKDQWFAWHRMFMLLTWSLTMAGFVIIFVYIGGWSEGDNIHPILGIVTTILAFIQPIGAAFRPHPESRRRPIFNWLHWLVGNIAHILAIVTIFFAGQLEKAELKDPEWLVLGLLVAYVAFHVCMHLMLSIAGCVSECHSSKRINSFPMKEMSNSRSPLQSADRRQDAPHACFRKFLLAIYILGILGLTTALIVIIVLAPIEESWKNIQEMYSKNSTTPKK